MTRVARFSKNAHVSFSINQAKLPSTIKNHIMTAFSKFSKSYGFLKISEMHSLYTYNREKMSMFNVKYL